MQFPHTRFTRLTLFALLVVGMPRVQADEDSAEDKLAAAKKSYTEAVEKFNAAVILTLDRRDEEARRVGNKKLVDQLKTERVGFEKGYTVPTILPTESHRQALAARLTLDKSFAAAIRESLIAKKDTTAEELVKEREKSTLEATLLLGKRTYLSKLQATDVKVWNKVFDKETARFKIDGFGVPHSIFMHPEWRGIASATYALPPKSRAFKVIVGLPKYEDNTNNPGSPQIFEVVGDDRRLWKSGQIGELDKHETCIISVQGIKTLTLRVNCTDQHGGAHDVWFAPVVAE